MPLAGFKPTLPASKRVQAHALDHTTTWIGCIIRLSKKFIKKECILEGGLHVKYTPLYEFVKLPDNGLISWPKHVIA